ncbi:MAG: 30S ribosomal protein S1 [Candidatus Harrisonbacteria bacterium CG10_big_fil_rev_8_21_14_0_10_40_38]|uniref:30S ribosomal protein S1 n=1 Tax=Candidatus Harrisonbacteria bacterium CG10_big_fil_rev_8_21_14_0_10_40_38 TaxID=1974583 RepID=A0A2H0URA7_9BACT|nr:MAG: 30S ribosomal protein S1 [Candidatus Harrisonbacteria bacterium CG10_big_fil_rev_8_21_14_0_10_40_38]
MRKNNLVINQLLKLTSGLSILKPSDLVEGILIESTAKSAYFDLGAFGTGIVYGAEFSNASRVIKGLKTGDKISAKVVDVENENGYVELSLTEAGAQKVWDSVKEFMEQGEIITVKITGANSGGLLAEVNNMRAFLPVSQLTTDHYPRVDDGDKGRILEELRKLVGSDLKVKIIDIKPRANKIILSERETVQENVKELLAKYKVDDIVDGIISGVADFGAFMRFADNPQIEGLIHISELDHRLIENPKDVVKIGDAVKAKIIEIKDNRVSLSLKALKPDPWEKVEDEYKPGDEVKGSVTRFNPFGAFILLDEDIQGLIHVSEFGSVEDMKKALEEGKMYTFKVELVKASEKRIILKLKK